MHMPPLGLNLRWSSQPAQARPFDDAVLFVANDQLVNVEAWRARIVRYPRASECFVTEALHYGTSELDEHGSIIFRVRHPEYGIGELNIGSLRGLNLPENRSEESDVSAECRTDLKPRDEVTILKSGNSRTRRRGSKLRTMKLHTRKPSMIEFAVLLVVISEQRGLERIPPQPHNWFIRRVWDALRVLWPEAFVIEQKSFITRWLRAPAIPTEPKNDLLHLDSLRPVFEEAMNNSLGDLKADGWARSKREETRQKLKDVERIERELARLEEENAQLRKQLSDNVVVCVPESTIHTPAMSETVDARRRSLVDN